MKFNELMARSSSYRDKNLPEKWQLLEYLFNNRQTSGAKVIPKIIHQIWLGSEPDSNLKKYMDSVKSANPDYEYRLWTDKEVETIDFNNKNLFLSCKNFGQRSDILRYAVLEKFGGIYLDTDFLGIKSFDELLHHNFFTGVAYDKEPTLFNGLIGSVPNHPLLKELNNIEQVEDYDGMAIIKSTGPWYLTRKLFKYIKSYNDAIVYPVAYFYPFPNFERDKDAGNDYRNYIREETVCVHMWDSRWN
jgi:mannosyltransferase OCH1-like enzyme